MICTVIWMPIAVERLAMTWMDASDRTLVAYASNEIDRVLAIDPESIGDARFDTVREVIVWPLGVEFEVDLDDRLVRILSVWDATKGPPAPTGN